MISLGLKWGMSELVSDGLLDSVHIAIASLKNGSGCLMSAAALFVNTRLRYRVSTAQEKDMRRQCWVLGGVAPDLFELCACSGLVV